MTDWWVTEIDSINLNDGVNWSTQSIPEVDNAPPYEHILVDMADDWPTYVRSQPVSGVYSVNLNVLGVTSDTVWYSRLNALRAVLTPGYHTLTVKRRGWPSEVSVQVLYRSMATNYQMREVSLDLLAPRPVLE